MPFPDLQEFVQGRFAELDGHDEYEAQLTLWCYRRRKAESMRKAAWRWKHPKARSGEYKRRLERSKANKTCRYCTKPPSMRTRIVRGRPVRFTLCEQHLESRRVIERKKYAAKKAA